MDGKLTLAVGVRASNVTQQQDESKTRLFNTVTGNRDRISSDPKLQNTGIRNRKNDK